jgi:pyrroloquinoline quinone (PQQ) biosynthesis protein C
MLEGIPAPAFAVLFFTASFARPQQKMGSSRMASSTYALSAVPALPYTRSRILRAKIDLAEDRLHAASYRLWSHPELAELFPLFLIQLYHVVRGGLDLMAFAAGRAEAMPGDAAAAIAAAYLRHHIEEEADHAGWLLRDLAVLGITEEQVLRAEPLPAVVSLIGTQYFRIASAHPASVFGYLIVLEGSPPLVAQLDAIQKRTGLHPDAFLCLRSHAEDDPAHLADLNETFDRMPLTDEQQRTVALSAFQTIDDVASLLDQLVNLHAPSPVRIHA